MGLRTSYPAGTFSWVDLPTMDVEAAATFYSAIFGWDAQDMPVPGDMPYKTFTLAGKAVAACYQRPGEQPGPPAWTSYVTVNDAAAAASKAKELGGSVLSDAFDVSDFGRMAVLTDPQGAVFAIWEPKSGIGAEVVNEPGSLTWNDLQTTDLEGAEEFYTSLFGWTTKKTDIGGGASYVTYFNRGRTNGGMMKIRDGQETPAHWLPYFVTESTDTAVARTEDLGGKVAVAAMDLPSGRIAVVMDPQGAAFALFEGETDD